MSGRKKTSIKLRDSLNGLPNNSFNRTRNSATLKLAVDCSPINSGVDGYYNPMGSSFIDFKDYGFWARDPGIEAWLYLLVQEIDKLGPIPDWLKEARDHWYTQATVGFIGCIHPQLDDYLVSQDRINLIVMLSERVLKWLARQGKYLSQEYLNSLGIGGEGSCWTADVEVGLFAQIGEKFIGLLRGELKTDASTSPVF